MAELITATEVHEINTGAASGYANSSNPLARSLAGDQIRPTQYFVGLYSVNRRRMADSQYAFIVENGAFKTVAIPTCPANKRYVKVMDIAHPVQAIEADPNSFGETIVRVTSAARVAMSIVHPDVIGESMEHLPAQSTLAKYAISSNCDLIKQGVFFTKADEGSPAFLKMLAAAESRRDSYYRQALDGLLGMGEAEISRVLASDRGLDLRTAAEHFGEDYAWIRRRAPKVDCPNCFEKIPQGAAFHKNDLLGVICIIDWKRAVEAGVKSKADVPDSKRWWNDAPPSGDEPLTLDTMTKAQLIEFGGSLGLELDPRTAKAELIAQIKLAAGQ